MVAAAASMAVALQVRVAAVKVATMVGVATVAAVGVEAALAGALLAGAEKAAWEVIQAAEALGKVMLVVQVAPLADLQGVTLASEMEAEAEAKAVGVKVADI